MLIDTHAHVNFNAFKDDADEVIKRSLKENVFMINVGSQYSTSVRAIGYSEKYGVYPHTKEIPQTILDDIKSSGFNVSDFGVGVYAAVGLHPIHVKEEEFDYEKYLELARNEKVVAVGEMGLDYHHFDLGDNVKELEKKQKEVFEKGIDLANQVNKPMSIHCWDAYDELLEILKNKEVVKKGAIHCFIGGYKTAKKFTELGFKIGLNGIMTYSEDYNRLIKELPLEDIILETDCPYLTPKPLSKDERNEPTNVRLVAEKIAQIKQISVEEVAEITTQNAKALFSI